MQPTAARAMMGAAAADAQRQVDKNRTMHLAVILGAFAAMSIWSAHSTIGGQESRAQRRSLDCERSFLASDDAKALVARFGASAVATGEIDLGEGFYETGTVLFGDTPEWRVEILWHDAAAQAKPKFVRVRAQSSRWHTPEGLTPGLDLHAVERLNSKPFRMTGFGTDYEGTLLSWAHGRLGPSAGVPCSVGVRLRPDDSVEYKHWYRQVIGAREFSSGHPAMQYLNPRVYEMWLDFRQAS